MTRCRLSWKGETISSSSVWYGLPARPVPPSVSGHERRFHGQFRAIAGQSWTQPRLRFPTRSSLSPQTIMAGSRSGSPFNNSQTRTLSTNSPRHSSHAGNSSALDHVASFQAHKTRTYPRTPLGPKGLDWNTGLAIRWTGTAFYIYRDQAQFWTKATCQNGLASGKPGIEWITRFFAGTRE